VERIEHREFQRHPIDLAAVVRFRDAEGMAHQEDTILCDVSGNGVCFYTRQEDRIAAGQQIGIAVILPRIQDIRARMTATGCVVRITRSEEATGTPATVAVRLDGPLLLCRDARDRVEGT